MKYSTNTFLDNPYFNQYTDPYKNQGAKAILEVLEELGIVSYDPYDEVIRVELVTKGTNPVGMVQRISAKQFARLLSDKLR